MDCCDFPPALKLDCVLELVRLVRSGELISAKADVLKHAGCLVGSLGAYLNSLDDPQLMGEAAHDLPCNLDECCDEVEATLGSVGANEVGISPAVVALLLRLAELLIAKYL